MAEKKSEIKTALLLSPVKIIENKQLLWFIQIRKNEKGLQYDITDLDESKIRRYCDKLPQQAQVALRYLNSEGLNKLEDEITKRFKQQKSGMLFRQFLIPAYTRQLQERFEMIKPFAQLMKWYHQVPNPATGNVMTAPCVFSNYKPVLKFEVVKEKEELQLVTIISINGSDYQLETFRRFHFLLLSNNEYFLLSHKDYRTMEWLLQNDPQQYSQDATLFAQKILSVLETDYDVNRNNLFVVTTVEVMPVKRILLSEISNSFLVLTPQWLYDGYIAEGVWKESFEASSNGEVIVIKRT